MVGSGFGSAAGFEVEPADYEMGPKRMMVMVMVMVVAVADDVASRKTRRMMMMVFFLMLGPPCQNWGSWGFSAGAPP